MGSFSKHALALDDSATHGTKARIDALNKDLPPGERIIDLGIGTLDASADSRIDAAVIGFIGRDPETIHAFGPVKGFDSLRAAVAARTFRLHGVRFDPAAEVIVTPGGIKGTLSVVFHAFLDEGDEVVVPVPNWPHYADMVGLHGAVARLVPAPKGLTPEALAKSLTDKTKLVILGDCINPTGKVYSTAELEALARVIKAHNSGRAKPVHVVFDCPYEAHVPVPRAKTLAAIDGMRPWTVTVTGPGKTYGMHGDRIGYACAAPETVAMMARVQVNLNSFASTYAQVAAQAALQQALDEVAQERAAAARRNRAAMEKRLGNVPGLAVPSPDGGYFLFVDLTGCSAGYRALGYEGACSFLLKEARVAAICGSHFAPGHKHHVRLNCGRSADLLEEAASRIARAVSGLRVPA